MERWSGKVALVTGAASGMGAAITEEFSKNGIIVFAVDVSDEIQKLKGKIGRTRGDVIPVKCDVTKEEEVSSVFGRIKNEFGAIHILVNAAGIGRIGLLSEAKIQLFRDVFDVNVMGILICTQKALKLMKESGVDNGQIIHINSVSGHRVSFNKTPAFNVYPATKHAVTALTELLRQELIYLETKIKVSSISPGLVETEFGQNARNNSPGHTADPNWTERFKNGPRLEPKDIADAAVFILSTPPHVQIHELIIKPVGEQF